MNHQIGDLNLTSTPKNLRPVEEWPEKIRLFSEAVRDGGPSPIPPRWAYLVNVIMDGMLRSAEAGEEVAVAAEF